MGSIMLHFFMTKKWWARAKNDAGERIESLRFSVPALRVGVLEYAPGQLQTNNPELDGKPVKLYYPPEAVSDEKFLKSLETAPVVVGGHDSTTNEQNKRIDGWAHSVSYDEATKAAIISGVVKGAKEVAYIRSNLGSSGFGASAFVDIYNLKVEEGVTPDGQSYNAIAQELRATHVALAPNVRDPENKIKVSNAVVINSQGVVDNAIDEEYWVRDVEQRIQQLKSDDDRRGLMSWLADWERMPEGSSTRKSLAKSIESQLKKVSIKNSEEQQMDEKAIAALVAATVKNTMDEMAQAKNEGDRMSALEETVKKHGEVLNEINEKLGGKKAEGENAEGEEKKEDKSEEATLENAKPSQAMVSVFATACNVDFGAKTPSFSVLASLVGINEKDPAKRIAAVNTKFAELSAKKTTEEKSTVEVF